MHEVGLLLSANAYA